MVETCLASSVASQYSAATTTIIGKELSCYKTRMKLSTFPETEPALLCVDHTSRGGMGDMGIKVCGV